MKVKKINDSTKEKILQLAADGIPYKEIVEITGISYRSIKEIAAGANRTVKKSSIIPQELLVEWDMVTRNLREILGRKKTA